MSFEIKNPLKEFYAVMEAEKKITKLSETDLSAINERISDAMEKSELEYSKKERESLIEATKIILNA